MSSAAFSIPNGSQPKVSLNRRGQRPSTATSSAADEAIQRILDARRRRHQYGEEPEGRQSALAGLVDQLNSAVGESVGRLGLMRWMFTAVVLGAVGVVLVVSLLPSGSKIVRHAISGSVAIGGRPLAQAALELHAIVGPEGGDSFTVKIDTNEKGVFSRSASVGIPPGTYAVVVKSGCIMANPDAERGTPIRIPAAYKSPSSTPLKISVDRDESAIALVLKK